MSIDHEHPYDILAMNGASAALMVSDIPFPAPVGAVRIGQDAEGNFLDEEWLLESPLDLVVAGTEEAILMVEAGANEITEARSSTRSTSLTPRSSASARPSTTCASRPAS